MLPRKACCKPAGACSRASAPARTPTPAPATTLRLSRSPRRLMRLRPQAARYDRRCTLEARSELREARTERREGGVVSLFSLLSALFYEGGDQRGWACAISASEETLVSCASG